MLTKEEVRTKMKERGFTEYAYMGSTKTQFISEHIYVGSKEDIDKPVLNVIVKLENGEFMGTFVIQNSINVINTPWCSPIMSDEHFNKIIGKLEQQARWMNKLKD